MAAQAKQAKGKKKDAMYFVHVAIALVILVLFWAVLPAPDPITPVGMRVAGAFLCMIYLWSTVEVLWPSIFGLVMVGLSGIGGDAGFTGVVTSAIGSYMALMTLFVMILLGAVDASGGTLYIAKFILSRKIIAGRPYVFLALFLLCCWCMATLMSPVITVLLIFPIALRVVEVIKVDRNDAIWKWLFVGMFVISTMPQPFLPFYDAQFIPVSTYQSVISAMGLSDAYGYQYAVHMAVNFIMSMAFLGIYVLVVKLLRVDVSKVRSISYEMVEATMPLPPMNTEQKILLILIPIYILGALAPTLLPPSPIADVLTDLGATGVAMILCLVAMVVRMHGKPLMNFREVAYTGLDWGAFFMIASAVYTATSLSSDETGVSAWMMQILNPILGGQSEMAFVAILLAFTMLITSFANNAAMGLVMTPIAIQFSLQLGLNPLPVEMCVVMVAFVAMLTPAASPAAGLLWGKSDIVSPRDIVSIGAPMSLAILLGYIFVGYPLAKGLCALLGAA